MRVARSARLAGLIVAWSLSTREPRKALRRASCMKPGMNPREEDVRSASPNTTREETSVHSWRPAPREAEVSAESQSVATGDGVHLQSEGRRGDVSAEPDAPYPHHTPVPRRRATSAGIIAAGCFAVALIVLFVLAPAALLKVYVAVPATLVAAGLVYYIRRGTHQRIERFERQPPGPSSRNVTSQ